MRNNFTEKRFLSFLPTINFVLSFLIIFHHSVTLDIVYHGSYNLMDYGFDISFERFMYNVSECAVPIFFFLSAYLFYRTFDGSWLQYKAKVNRRFFSLFIPYIIFGIIGYLKYIIFNNQFSFDIFIILKSILMSETLPLWFIRELIILSLIAPLIYMIKDRLWLIICSDVLIILLIAFEYVRYQSFLYWLPIYLFGARMGTSGLYSLIKRWNNINSKIKILIIFIFISSAWFLPNGAENGNSINILQFAIYRNVTPIIFLLLVSSFWERPIDYQYMHYSFFVYCMHAPVISLMIIIYDNLLFQLIPSEIIKYGFIICTTYILCVCIAMTIEFITPKLWIILNGRR